MQPLEQRYAILFLPEYDIENTSTDKTFRRELLPWRCYGPYSDIDQAYNALVGTTTRSLSNGRVVLLRTPEELAFERSVDV